MQSKKIKIKCQHCGKVISRYHVKNRPQIFCSRDCYLHSMYHSKIQKIKMIKRNWRGFKNPAWKGSEVSYKGIHRWIMLNYGAAKEFKCIFCQNKKGSFTMNWASLDHKHSRDISTWLPLCKICHSNYDQKQFKLYS